MRFRLGFFEDIQLNNPDHPKTVFLATVSAQHQHIAKLADYP
jgi:hypothetical protein